MKNYIILLALSFIISCQESSTNSIQEEIISCETCSKVFSEGIDPTKLYQTSCSSVSSAEIFEQLRICACDTVCASSCINSCNDSLLNQKSIHTDPPCDSCV